MKRVDNKRQDTVFLHLLFLLDMNPGLENCKEKLKAPQLSYLTVVSSLAPIFPVQSQSRLEFSKNYVIKIESIKGEKKNMSSGRGTHYR